MKISAQRFLNSLLIVLFCTTRFWGENIPWYVNVIVRILVIILLIIDNKFIISFSRKVKKIIKLTILPIVLIAIYSCTVWFLGDGFPASNVVRNLFTSSLYLIIDVFFGALLYEKYKEETVDLFVKCGFISYFLGSIIPLLFNYSFSGILYLLTSHSTNDKLLYLTEVNDLTFGIGFCLLFYLFFDKRKNKERKKNVIKCILMIFWGLKRIEIAAIILCYLFYKFVVSKMNIKKSAFISTVIIMIVSYTYIMFIHNNTLINLAEKYNINFMGRLKTYIYVANNYSNFSWKFLGIGFGNIDEILEILVSKNFRIDYIPVISLHSDILRMYIGIGFIAFGLWVIYQNYIKTKIIGREINTNCAKAYIVFTVYLFILYLTDNTYSYPITFSLYIICTLCSIKDENTELLMDSDSSIKNINKIGEK